ncbi:ATP-binding protein [Kitasatospora sp. RG8]|uniref:ATP-binding protein n=1 Tax=Kitasatospora sp. RG8 TaxID=2820815 RepID=UPI001ADF1900|nr:ATP-binding protein [Kitasatospora sp. RG8]MBP0448935.1 ATP-binding protein [Kitasatospora sp. RG8]
MNRTTVGGPEIGGRRGAGGVVVLADPAGAGSGTVAPLLADALHPSVHLRADDFQRAVRQGYVPAHLPEAQRQNTTALAATAQAAFAFATGGYQVVVEAAVAPTALDAFRRESRTTGAALHYVVLRPAGASAEPGEPGGVPDRHTMDAAPVAPEAAAEAVLAGLSRRVFLLGW